MNNLKFESPSELAARMLVENSYEVRFIERTWGKDREIMSSNSCCVCNERIWVIANLGRMIILDEAFKVADPRAYVNGTPDYLKVSNSLLECHWTCQNELETQLRTGTFVQR